MCECTVEGGLLLLLLSQGSECEPWEAAAVGQGPEQGPLKGHHPRGQWSLSGAPQGSLKIHDSCPAAVSAHDRNAHRAPGVQLTAPIAMGEH